MGSLPGDTVAMFDAAQAHVLLFTAAGEAVRTEILATNRDATMRLPQPFGADARGRVQAHALPRANARRADSTRARIHVVRMDAFTSSSHGSLATLWFDWQDSPLQGVLFPPTGFWRTFVAFESRSPETLDSESDGARLSLIVSAPVLEYHYAENHFWAFLIWSAGERVSMYLCAFKRRKLDIDFESCKP